jgi:choline kinase
VSEVIQATSSAVLLAAGVGRRLGEDYEGPKALLAFDGRSLLRRHMEALAANGVRQLSITIGYQASKIREAVAAVSLSPGLQDLSVSFVENPDYRKGSLVSVLAQRGVLDAGAPVLLMDGDVLYDARMIARLLTGAGEGVLLVDRELEPGDEPVKICFDGAGRIVDFRKVPTRPHAWFGESVGFFRLSGDLAAELAERCAWYVAQGQVETEYEEAIRDLILEAPDRFAATDVSDLPWTEIDFPEDVVKARDVVLPQLGA